ncbi:DUF1800 domain-containing protein [Carboxylicivirga sp. M1479]|nr:DUF1800 family protein [uncultured Carboxylicivirga sp.]TRX72199.1 DUF1800 domain-containing protein [Carboxylicivirga sp. M1479]
MKSEHYYHLIRRAGFGSKLELEEALNDDREQVVARLFEEKAKVEPLLIDYPKLTQEEIRNLNEVQKKDLQKLNRKKIAEHNMAWLNRMVYSDSFLRERMTFFGPHFLLLQARIFALLNPLIIH